MPPRLSTAAFWAPAQSLGPLWRNPGASLAHRPRRRFHCARPSRLYLVSELVMSGESRALREHFEVGLSKYRANVWSDVGASAAVFIPVGIVNFRSCGR